MRAVWDDGRGDDSVGGEEHEGDHCVGGLRDGRGAVVEVADVSRAPCCRIGLGTILTMRCVKVDGKQRERTRIGSSTAGGGYYGVGDEEAGTHSSSDAAR